MSPSKQNITINKVSGNIVLIGDNATIDPNQITISLNGKLNDKVRGANQKEAFSLHAFIAVKVLPGLLIVLPLCAVLYAPISNAEWVMKLNGIVLCTIIGVVLVLLAIVAGNIANHFSQSYEKRLFQNKLLEPSVYFLSEDNPRLSSTSKFLFGQKYLEVFQLPFPINEESTVNKKYLKELSSAIRKVKGQLKVSYLMQALSIRYDFTRNTVFAAKCLLFSCLFLTALGVFRLDEFLISFGCSGFVFAVCVWSNQRRLLVQAAENHALQIIDEFIYQ